MTDGSDVKTGRCRCDSVRFEASGTPLFVGNCHCDDCRRATGAPFSTYVGFKDDKIRWTGDVRRRFESSDGVFRSFCDTCGTQLSYQGRKWAGETHLFVGAFDDATQFTPSGAVFPDEALPWVDVRIPRK